MPTCPENLTHTKMSTEFPPWMPGLSFQSVMAPLKNYGIYFENPALRLIWLLMPYLSIIAGNVRLAITTTTQKSFSTSLWKGLK